MASIVLSAAGGAAGSALAIPFGAAIGSQLGSALGGQIDNQLFGSGGKSRHRHGPRLEELAVQTSTYGAFIPIVYGNVRIAGNVIWSLPMKEEATTTTTTQGKGGGGVSSSSTEYSYYATLAVAICEGEVDRIERVWADAKQLDLGLGTYRFYKGDEEQQPDTLIESYEGVGTTPAYRGLCYVVIEDFPLAEYGNRIPNFTFEVKKKALWPDVDGEAIENLVKEMVLIPGSGEFVYDTEVQQKVEGEQVGSDFAQSGAQQRINQHTLEDKANALVALDQLEETCPNLEWVALVVNWFGTSMDITSCEILPGVEFDDTQATTQPESWSVGSFTRGTAHSITYVDETPRYGGTPDDQSVLRLCDELIARGKKILFLPLFLMDAENKPWRGRLTGTSGQIPTFFTKTNGYNAYVTHYANLLKDKVDAFAIGSEMRGITEVNDGASTNRAFPGVSALVSLAATVKGIVGSGVKVTYAADWSEYHHAEDGWYHMDPLWASPNIDVIGIDAYFPLTDAPQNEIGYDIGAIRSGWEEGEGYDWYYSDEERETQASLSAAYAWKNIAWFWENTHTNPDGNGTAWVAESKKIWFTEYGFPSVDAATNQPNVFYDETSSESYFPYQSKGRVDFRAQRAGIGATLAQWKDSAMVEKTFLWTWDARPYPYWPDLVSVWADGSVWVTGHWVQGKLGLSSLAAIVADLSTRAGLALADINVGALSEQVDGFIIKRQDTARGLIEALMSAYFFDAAETDGAIKYVPRGNASVLELNVGDMAPPSENAGEAIAVTRLQELELPQRIEVNYLNRLALYQTNTQASQRQVSDATDTEVMNLAIVMSDQYAKVVADVALYHAWIARTQYKFDLPMAYSDLEPSDVVTFSDENGGEHVMRITALQMGKPGRIHVRATADDVSSYDVYAPAAEAPSLASEVNVISETATRFLDLPAFPGEHADDAYLRVVGAGVASNWPGAAVYRSDDGGGAYGEVARLSQAAVMGTAITALSDGPRNRFDEAGYLDVVLIGEGALSSVTERALLNGANVAVVGNELIQFQNASLLSPNKYRLSRLLRGRLGTEHEMGEHSAGEGFVLLNGHSAKVAMTDGLFGLARDYKIVSIGKTLGSVSAQSVTYSAKALKPYAPVHVKAVRDGAGNMTIEWVRRTRVGGNWRDGGDVPLSEASELYVVKVKQVDTVLRTIDATAPQASYSAAEQAADFGSVQASVDVEICQVSQRVGAGFVAEAAL